MKKLLTVALATALSLGVCASEQLWSLVRPEGGFHYISIDQNLDAFSFDILKYENASLNGHAGYFVYQGDDMSGNELKNYIRENGVAIEKNQTTVDVGALNEGDKVGFYKWDTTGCGPCAKTTIDTSYIIGTKVVSRSTDMWGHTTETILDEGTFVDYISGDTYQTGHGGWMKIEISASAAAGGGGNGGGSGGGSGPANGAPLPGALAVMLVGGIGSLCAKKKRR